MGRVQTSVMIDEDKRALAKQRGIKLQDLLDEALNTVLELEIPGKAQLEIEKENILKNMEASKQHKKEYLANYEKELAKLEEDKEAYLKAHDVHMGELKAKLRLNEKALAEATEEQNELNQQREREEIIQRGVRALDIDKQLEHDMEEYCIKWNIADINQEIAIFKQEIINGIYGRNKKQ